MKPFLTPDISFILDSPRLVLRRAIAATFGAASLSVGLLANPAAASPDYFECTAGLPVEVANCTIDIHETLLDSPSSKVLELCGRSLLPERYGTCVVDIVDATAVTVDTALDGCIRAGYQPWRIEPRL